MGEGTSPGEQDRPSGPLGCQCRAFSSSDGRPKVINSIMKYDTLTFEHLIAHMERWPPPNIEVWTPAGGFAHTACLQSSHACGEIPDRRICFFFPQLIQHDQRPEQILDEPGSLSGSAESDRVSAEAGNNRTLQFYPHLCRRLWDLLL